MRNWRTWQQPPTCFIAAFLSVLSKSPQPAASFQHALCSYGQEYSTVTCPRTPSCEYTRSTQILFATAQSAQDMMLQSETNSYESDDADDYNEDYSRHYWDHRLQSIPSESNYSLTTEAHGWNVSNSFFNGMHNSNGSNSTFYELREPNGYHEGSNGKSIASIIPQSMPTFQDRNGQRKSLSVSDAKGQREKSNIDNKGIAETTNHTDAYVQNEKTHDNDRDVQDEGRNDMFENDLDSIRTETEANGKSRIWMSHRAIWKRRNARSAEEGIRREKLPQLSSLLLEKAKALDVQSPRYAARTIAGLVSALAEEVDDLDVEVVAQPDTPFWDKQVDEVKIRFSRLGFSPIKMGGLHHAIQEYNNQNRDASESDLTKKLQDLSCADEAFRQIDVDNSGFLDREEIGEALLLASGATDTGDDVRIIQELASDLLELYDVNGDGVISRGEYQMMVEDMAALVKKQQEQLERKEKKEVKREEKSNDGGVLYGYVAAVKQFFGNMFSRENVPVDSWRGQELEGATLPSSTLNGNGSSSTTMDRAQYVVNATESVEMIESMAKSLGSITLSDLKLDLRRLVFGAVPVIKHITPGGPLILEPFTVTITGSFNRDDIMKSSLLEMGLAKLIALVLRRRVRSLRDLTDFAVFFGRDYKLTSKNAPVTEVVELSNVEFDQMNRLVMTGRAKVRTRPGAPTIDQAFKVRAKLGTRKGGRFIRLVEPELAFVLECPKAMEEAAASLFTKLGMEAPARPKPLYSFFPIYSPFKPDDNDGFDLGDDNSIQKIYIQDGALRFELRTVLRPGRFLGSHYIAFTLPFRTFIITLDRVKEGIRAARKAKKLKRQQERLRRAQGQLETVDARGLDSERLRKKSTRRRPPRKSFFSRFVDGYMQADREETDRTKFTSAIRDFFGRQTGQENRSPKG
ncbi:hypothetical protein ACA910_005012 [Epithemia clementina (nom. ined.)]